MTSKLNNRLVLRYISCLSVWCMVMVTALPLFGQDATATLHIFRPNTRIFGAGSKPSIYIDGKALARLARGEDFTATVSPGKHMVTAGRSEVGQFMDFEPGKDYYLRLDFSGRKHWADAEPFVLTPVAAEAVTK